MEHSSLRKVSFPRRRRARWLNYSLAVANQMKAQTPQGGSIIGISSISALVGGGMQW